MSILTCCRIIPKVSLAKLLEMSNLLPGLTDEELKPIKVWMKMRQDDRLPRLRRPSPVLPVGFVHIQ